ncbi:hypothetical protein [Nocardia sp. NPDC019395]|uniref:hypothetical protein n=1 Tax=Nocardia sp. NPDC019395 TaxID=3154686 RepID=UPI0034035425
MKPFSVGAALGRGKARLAATLGAAGSHTSRIYRGFAGTTRDSREWALAEQRGVRRLVIAHPPVLGGVALAGAGIWVGIDNMSAVDPLDPKVADYIAMSPFMTKELARLREDGWRIGYRDVKEDTVLGYCDRDSKTIILDKQIQKDPRWTIAVLAHEIGHAYPGSINPETDPPKPGEKYMDWLRRNLYTRLEAEAESGLVSAQVRKEIQDNGGLDIGPEGGGESSDQTIAYEQILDGRDTREETRRQIVQYDLVDEPNVFDRYQSKLEKTWNENYAESHGAAEGKLKPDDLVRW